MYLEPFKLKELPFRLSPDPQFLYLSKQHARAKAYMESTIWFTDGFVVITGEIGAGKTTLIESFLKEIQSDVVIAHDAEAQLGKIRAPTQITFGRHDVVTSTRFASRLRESIAGSDVAVFEDCAHAAIYENVAAFNARTLDFLKRH